MSDCADCQEEAKKKSAPKEKEQYRIWGMAFSNAEIAFYCGVIFMLVILVYAKILADEEKDIVID